MHVSPHCSATPLAPQVFRRSYTWACDAWSLGVNLYLLLSGTVPFGARSQTAKEVHRCIREDPLEFTSRAWGRISSSARELVAGLLEKAPFKRYTIDQALAHPWVRGDTASDEALDRRIIESMYNFNAHNKFRRAALRVVSYGLSAADIRKLRTTFFEMDKDADQTVSASELAAALHTLGFSSIGRAVEDVMRAVDADGNGRIDIDEFLTATTELNVIHYQNEIWAAFCQVDVDGDGFIDAAEARQILGADGADAITRYIAEWDRDSDGRISYEEFVRMLLPKDLKFKMVKFT